MADPIKTAWVERVLGVSVAGQSRSGGTAIAGWKQARAEAVAQLRRLGRAIQAVEDPEADAAVILLEAIAKNLTPEPAHRRAVAELNRYLSTDDIITEAEMPNGYGIEVTLREPLLRALAPLMQELPE